MSETNNYRYLARFTVEAATPLAVGSGERGLLLDRLVARDANGLPYIPGTSLAGVIRHELDTEDKDEKVRELFGFQDDTDGQGSRILFSSAMLLAQDGKRVHEGLENIDFSEGFYSYFQKLPERDHVRITHRGAADVDGHGKFDEELVYKGTRFVFQVELIGTSADATLWNKALSLVCHDHFRIGGGTRKGFGQLSVVDCRTRTFDLTDREQMLAYLERSSSLNEDCSGWTTFEAAQSDLGKYQHYRIQLKPENFFHFGAGFGDEDVDLNPKKECFFEWDVDGAKLSEEQILIPATSVKGAIAHRVAYHHNRLSGQHLSNARGHAADKLPKFNAAEYVENHFAELRKKYLIKQSNSEQWDQLEKIISETTLEELLAKKEWKDFNRKLPNPEKGAGNEVILPVGERNKAVKSLFGYIKESDGEVSGARGKVIFSDVYLSKTDTTEKVFSHVMIDRFTGGALDGALYQEKAVQSGSFTLDIYVERSAFDTAEYVKEAFEQTLRDLMSGHLPLGGNIAKGHGAFTGTFEPFNV